MADPRLVLFLPAEPYAFDQQLALARYIEAESELRTRFLFVSRPETEQVAALHEAGIIHSAIGPAIAHETGSPTQHVAAPGIMRRGLRRVAGLEDSWPAGSIASVPAFLVLALFRAARLARRLRRHEKDAQKVLHPVPILCAVASQERLRWILPVLKHLKSRHVPVLLMPAADSSPDGSAWIRRDRPSLMAGLNPSAPLPGIGTAPGEALLNRLVARLMPEQVYASRWGRMLFTPAPDIIGMRLAGVLPRSLWYQGSGFVDFAVTMTDEDASLFRIAGVAEDRVLHFGTPENDDLFESWRHRSEVRRNITSKYGLDPRRPILLLALPPYFEQQLVESESEHLELLRELLTAVEGSGYNALISLHPRVNRGDYAWVEDEHQVRVCSESTREAMVCADVFAASFSSTARWAIALGMPVVNVDLLGFEFDMYHESANFETARSGREFSSLLASLKDRPGRQPYSEPMASRLVDGRARQRLLEFVLSLARA